ncbi:substrate-binding domain-containing protein [Myxococcota bacterium]|nr:substrate-binding domain-containing protein [Myxococcota bacterium]
MDSTKLRSSMQKLNPMSLAFPGLSLTAVVLSGALLFLTAAASADDRETESLLLATTTSVRDSGLLEVLLPPFFDRTGVEVRTVAVGTGAALRMGAEGNADLLITHAPDPEKQLLASGAISERREIMENFFVIAGPAEDPAEISEALDAVEALRRIQNRKSPFVSRADDSGTHKKEVELMTRAGLDPSVRWPGLTRTGSGMGQSLLVAGQRRAYILSDIGTFLAFRGRVELKALTGPSKDLRNVYSVLLVSPKRFPKVRGREARLLADYLQGETARSIMDRFGVERFGRPLFVPIAVSGVEPEA